MSLNAPQPPTLVRENVACALCGSNQTRVMYQVDTSQTVLSQVWIGEACYELAGREILVQCRRCGLVYVNPRIASVSGLAPYSTAQEMAYFADTRAVRWRAYRELWDRVPGWLGHKPASLLDIGCGDGLLMEIAKARGADVAGVEVSEPLLAVARERLGPGARLVSHSSQLLPAEYEVVALINVLEHLPNPRQMLLDVAKLIRPGGLVLVHVPNLGGLPARLAGARWHQIEPLAHYYYFTAQTLSQLLAQWGFQVQRRFSLIVSGRWLGGLGVVASNRGN